MKRGERRLKIMKKKTIEKKVKVDVPVVDITPYLRMLSTVGKSTPVHHAKNATKELLLVMRSILDEAIDVLEESPNKKTTSKKRRPLKIKIR
jgi:hypothetical protein